MAHFFLKKSLLSILLDSGCVSVGRAVQIQSSAKFILNICLLSTVLKRRKEKEGKEWPILEVYYDY